MKVFNPITNITPAPDVIDGFLNLVTRQGQASVNNPALTTLTTFNLIPNFFNALSQNQRLNIDFFGQLIGAGGNKQIRILFDATVIHDTGTAAFSNTNYNGLLKICITVPPTNIRFNSRIDIATAATGAITNQQQFNSNAIAIDSTIAHTITFQATNANGADQITLDHLFAYLG